MQMFTPHIPSDAPFSGDQRAWLGGYLAGLKSHADLLGINGSDQQSSSPPLDILFGTQTGNAEAVAEDAAVFVGLWAALANPEMFLIGFVLVMALLIWLMPKIFRGIRAVFSKIANWFSGSKPAVTN